MNWINKHVTTDFLSSYNEKYGNDGYWQWQKEMFRHSEMIESLRMLITKISNPENILNIGINNAYEFEVISSFSLCNWNWGNIHVTGVDLSLSALEVASKLLNKLSIKHDLVHSDITEINSFNKNFNLCMAITSLQSAVIYDKNFIQFMQRMIKLMDKNSTFFIVVPNCAIENGKIISGGAYNVRLKKQDPLFANTFIGDCSRVLSEFNYENTIFGSDFITLIAQKAEK